MASTDAPNGGPPAYTADLLPIMIPFFDRHLIFPLVNDREKTTETRKALIALLKPTYMTDYVGNLHKELEGLDKMPSEYDAAKEDVLKKKKDVEEKTTRIREVLEDPEIIGNLRSDKIANMNYLKDFGVTEEMVAGLWEYGQFHYQCGNYQEAAQALQEFRVLVRFTKARRRILTNKSPLIPKKSPPPAGVASRARSSKPNGRMRLKKSSKSRKTLINDFSTTLTRNSNPAPGLFTGRCSLSSTTTRLANNCSICSSHQVISTPYRHCAPGFLGTSPQP
jgi:hypothetical protein